MISFKVSNVTGMRTILFTLFITIFNSVAYGQWVEIDSITHGNLYSVNFMNADTGFTYNEPGILRRTIDGGQSWDTVQTVFTGYINDLDMTASGVGYCVGGAWFPVTKYYSFGIMKTMDFGVTWDSVYGNWNGGVFDYVEVVTDNEFYAGANGFVVHSTDGGASFDTIEFNPLLPQGVETYGKPSFISPTKGYMIGNSSFFGGYQLNFYETTDGGQSWNPIYTDTISRAPVEYVMDASGNGIIFAWQNKSLITNDGGMSWQFQPKPDTAVTYWKVQTIDGHLYASGVNYQDNTSNIYFSPDWGKTWQVQYSFPASTGGIVDFSIPTATTGYFVNWREVYKNGALISIPETGLTQPTINVYPVPANDILNLEFPGRGIRQISLFNGTGQLVLEKHDIDDEFYVLDMSSLKRGNYLLVVSCGSTQSTVKFVKF